MRNEATASAVQVVPLAVRTFVRFNVMAIASSAITFRSERTIVYNFRVTDWHTYFVATNDNDAIWVHNADYAIVAPSVGGRGPWSLTSEGASREMRHDGFGRFFQSKSDGLWWAVDNAGHGESSFKVFNETGKGLEWFRDADEYGDFILGKHKGPTGLFIPWKELSGR